MKEKNIQLKYDKDKFADMKADKVALERDADNKITWEDYFWYLFKREQER